MARIDEPDKNWKFSLAPADDKENARLIVSRVALDALEDLKIAYPKTARKAARGIAIDPQTSEITRRQRWLPIQLRNQ